MSGIAQGRIRQERKQWRRDHPHGFYARPKSKPDGSSDLFTWECGVPGKDGTPWEGGVYKCTLTFSQDYPSNAPKVHFTPPLIHANCYQSGKVCLSILNEGGWKPGISIKQIMTGLQEWLDTPNWDDAANSEAMRLHRMGGEHYTNKVKAQAKQFAKP